MFYPLSFNVWSRMNTLRCVKWLLIALLFLRGSACIPSSPDPTPEDRAALAVLQEQFGDRYDFSFQYDVYVRIRPRFSGGLTREEATQIVKVFRSHAPSAPISFDEKSRLRSDLQSHIAYFNFYGFEGQFLFQVYWDPQRSAAEFSEQEFPS